MPGNMTLFTATNPTYGLELWITDGTQAGSLGNGKVVFQADDGSTGKELWITDGTSDGTVQLKNINPDTPSPNIWNGSPSNFATLKDPATGKIRVLFSANNGTDGTELWATDGTAAGTAEVSNINSAGPAGGEPAFQACVRPLRRRRCPMPHRLERPHGHAKPHPLHRNTSLDQTSHGIGRRV